MRKLALCLLLGLSLNALGHPLAPGLLTLTEKDAGQFDVIWKLPVKIDPERTPQPHLPGHCRITGEPEQNIVGTGRVTRLQLQCSETLTGSELGVKRLLQGESGILLRITLRDGRFFHRMLSAEEPRFTVPEKRNAWQIAGNYTGLGIEHLFGGIDHVLFIITLFALVGWNTKLFWTVTLFTLGHSITLSLTVLGFVAFPQRLTEAFIALSIIMTASEWIRDQPDSAFRRHTWVLALLFGLLHGMGFAGALKEIGLPQSEVPLALASFNIGIEVGQLLIIALCAALLHLLLRLRREWPRWSRWLPGYAVGVTASFWFWQRLFL